MVVSRMIVLELTLGTFYGTSASVTICVFFSWRLPCLEWIFQLKKSQAQLSLLACYLLSRCHGYWAYLVDRAPFFCLLRQRSPASCRCGWLREAAHGILTRMKTTKKLVTSNRAVWKRKAKIFDKTRRVARCWFYPRSWDDFIERRIFRFVKENLNHVKNFYRRLPVPFLSGHRSSGVESLLSA